MTAENEVNGAVLKMNEGEKKTMIRFLEKKKNSNNWNDREGFEKNVNIDMNRL